MIRYFWRYEITKDHLLDSMENLVLHIIRITNSNYVSVSTDFDS